MSVWGRGEASKSQIFCYMSIKPFGLKSRAYAYAAPESRHSNCREAIVFLRHGNNCVYKWTAEIWGLKETWGQIGNDSWRREFVEGRISSVKLGSLPWLRRPTSARRYHSKLCNGFLLCKNLCFQVPGTPVGLFIAHKWESIVEVGKLSGSLWKEHRYHQHMAALSTELHLSNFINKDSQEGPRGNYCRQRWAET